MLEPEGTKEELWLIAFGVLVVAAIMIPAVVFGW